jgi:2-polyprenyl-6-methoxyphenol hydroxylase-like FAD-dependent oxidoreductase
MEFCRRWGIAKEVKESGAPPDFPPTILYITSLDGWELLRIERPTHGGYKPLPTTPERSQRCNQIWFDPILHRLASSFKTAQLRYKTKYESWEKNGDGVTVTVRDQVTGEASRIAARYLIDCSGGASGIGKALGVKQIGRPVLSYHCNIFLKIDKLWEKHDKGKAAFYFLVGKEGDYGSLIEIDGRELWRLGVHGDEWKEEPSKAHIDATIRRALGPGIPYEIISVNRWTCRDLVADRFQFPPVFLAGDCVHQHAPSGGFGMNTGMGDAVDLGWKLAAMIEGWGGPSLLESYEPERHHVAERNVGEATDNVLRTTDPELIKYVEDKGPKGVDARAKIGADIKEHRTKTFITDGIALGYIYDSAVIVPDGTKRPQETVMDYTPTTYPGARAPHAWVAEGKSTLDLFGKKFVLMRSGGADPAALVAAAKQRGVPLEVFDIADPEIAKLYEKKLVLVRPDGHVSWRGDQAPSDPLAVIDAVRGAAKAGAAKRAA